MQSKKVSILEFGSEPRFRIKGGQNGSPTVANPKTMSNKRDKIDALVRELSKGSRCPGITLIKKASEAVVKAQTENQPLVPAYKELERVITKLRAAQGYKPRPTGSHHSCFISF